MCFASDHDRSFAQLPVAQVRTLIDALADRTQELSRLREVSYVYCFENRDADIGVTISHLLGQSGLRRFDALFDSPAPYIAGWQQAPVRRDRDVWHLALEVFTIRRANDKLKYLAGSESGAGVWINDVRPEDAAAKLRAGR